MEAIPRKAFFTWASRAGIGINPRYPASGFISLIPSRRHARFWELPADSVRWPHFVATMVAGLDEWKTAYLWPRSGGWPAAPEEWSHNEAARDVLLHSIGIPRGWAGAVRLIRGEQDKLLAVLTTYCTFGGCVDDDLFFVPDHGKQLLHSDHHDAIHVECASKKRLLQLVKHMAEAGFDLPTELPDPTFKRPAWMTGD